MQLKVFFDRLPNDGNILEGCFPYWFDVYTLVIAVRSRLVFIGNGVRSTSFCLILLFGFARFLRMELVNKHQGRLTAEVFKGYRKLAQRMNMERIAHEKELKKLQNKA